MTDQEIDLPKFLYANKSLFVRFDSVYINVEHIVSVIPDTRNNSVVIETLHADVLYGAAPSALVLSDGWTMQRVTELLQDAQIWLSRDGWSPDGVAGRS